MMDRDIASSLVDRIKQAYRNKTPLKITGNGNRNNILARQIKAEPLKVSPHSGIVSYQPTELVLTVRAGTQLSDISRILADNGQHLSFEPPYFGKKATIGGTVACNLSGPARPWAGSVRDMVLGIRLINGRGEHLRFGGQVMKNVAGYDVSRLQAGALGSLGVMTEISLKVLPKPETSTSLVFEMDQESALHKMHEFSGKPSPLSGAVWFDGKMYIRLSGTLDAVEQTVQLWGGDQLAPAHRFWEDLREQRLDFFNGDAPLWRLAIRSNSKPTNGDFPVLIDWGGGQRWLRGEHELARLEQLALKNNGHITLFRGGDRIKNVRQSLDTVQKKLHLGIKRAFDPEGIFNPGILYNWMV